MAKAAKAGLKRSTHTLLLTLSAGLLSSAAGLGLAITHAVVELMGGTITFESEEGKGTTFRMLLPFGDVPESHSHLDALENDDDLPVIVVIRNPSLRVRFGPSCPCDTQRLAGGDHR